VGIPLPKLLRHWREQALASGSAPRERLGLRAWAWLSRHPWLYRRVLGLAARVLRSISIPTRTPERRRIRRLPLGNGWTLMRDLPAPEGETFQERWRRERLPW
jgi:L-lactate dehydrogenase complex protein LldF